MTPSPGRSSPTIAHFPESSNDQVESSSSILYPPPQVSSPSGVPTLQKQMDPAPHSHSTNLESQHSQPPSHVSSDQEGDPIQNAAGLSMSTTSMIDDEQAVLDGSHKSSSDEQAVDQLVLDKGLISTIPLSGTPSSNIVAHGSLEKPTAMSNDAQDPISRESILPEQNRIDPPPSVLAGNAETGHIIPSPQAQHPQENSTSTLMTSTSVGNPDVPEALPSVETNGNGLQSTQTGQVDYRSLLENLIQPISTIHPPTNTVPLETPDSTSTVEPNPEDPNPRIEISPSANVTTLHSPSLPEDNAASVLPNDAISLHSLIDKSQASSIGNTLPTQAFRVPPGLPAPVVAAGAPGTSSAVVGLPPPPGATFERTTHQDSAVPNDQDSLERSDRLSLPRSDQDEAPWGPETQKVYDQFLLDERVYVAEGQWEQFPPDSRLFVGNLATESVTKRDLFHVFHKYGKLAQLSIKQAFGFIQYFDAKPCRRALHAEQDTEIRGKRIHLELSKPPRSSNRRRSRSPDRGVTRDGYNGRSNSGRTRVGRERDDYRPGRSPSPHSAGRRGDRYRGTGVSYREMSDVRKRSRSRSPYGRSTRMRDRSPSPRRRGYDDDQDLLPRRAPGDVPEVQLVVIDDLDRNFIEYVSQGFKNRGIRIDILFLSPRLQLQAVLQRQAIEGVQAVVRLARPSQNTGKVPLQLYDRRGGSDNVRFDEYEDLTPDIAAELVIRARQTHAAPIPQSYNAPRPPAYAQTPYQPPFANTGPLQPQISAAGGADLSTLISSLDGQGLQKLLGALQQQAPPLPPPPQQQQPQPVQNHRNPSQISPELAGLLNNAGRPQQQNAYQSQQPPSNRNGPYGPYAGQPAFSPNGEGDFRLQHQPVQQQQHYHQSPPQQPANGNNIMDQLARWSQS